MDYIKVGVCSEHRLLMEGIYQLIENVEGIQIMLKENCIDKLLKCENLPLIQRNTNTPKSPTVFQGSIADDPRNLQLWDAFLSRIKADVIDFSFVMQTIKERLEPIYKEILK